ncbi:hypothetical protein ASG25_21880 [Rhizobium sp. Leaf384]|uniref:phage tail terminator-like protein n=1 Tax=unclassified Rhizobium TaxID=2613769 RepID=UPI000715BAA7|nr:MULTISPECIES: phage tail terminator-like protein [unclassified Rhizobium]KQS78084.1 hypothetical protein ASG58_06650 [Rhizobium sp. Leaf383]KQS79709.1 hypothetical protein ASG25_21880 [Rhizobium sp. Leaf384]
MSSLNAYNLIMTRLAEWVETPVSEENDGFSTPDVPAPFVYVEVVGDMLEQQTVGAPGSNLWLESGVVYLHVMTPNGAGSRDARGIAERLTMLFRERPLGDLHPRQMSIGAGDPGRSFGGYYAMTATITWDRQDYTTNP